MVSFWGFFATIYCNLFSLYILFCDVYRKGSFVSSIVIALDRGFEDHPSILVRVLNRVDTLAGYRLDKSYTYEKGIIIIT